MLLLLTGTIYMCICVCGGVGKEGRVLDICPFVGSLVRWWVGRWV